MGGSVLIAMPLWAWYAMMVAAAIGVGATLIAIMRFVMERLVAWQFRHELERRP